MAQGNSGRVVIELDPRMKQRLHYAVRSKGWPNLKAWFLAQAQDIITTTGELPTAASQAPEPGDDGNTDVQLSLDI